MPLLNLLRAALAAGLAANGLAMLFAPEAWYQAVPGVAFTGPLNTHFVRDIGCAYLVSGASLGLRAWCGSTVAPGAMVGATFLLLHAAVHLGETLAGLCGWSTLLRDVPGVVLPAIAAFALGWPSGRPRLSSSLERSSVHAA
jgi:hypothetical protein